MTTARPRPTPAAAGAYPGIALSVSRPVRPARQEQRQGQGRGPGEDGTAPFMVPIPKVHDLSVLNERLLARWLERLDALEAGEQAAALPADLDALRDLPAVPFEACEHMPGQVSSTALVRYRLADYSAPTVHAHKKVTVKGYVDRVRSRSAPRSSPAIGAPMSAATSPTTRCTICRCWRRSRAPWTRRRRCGDGSSIRPLTRCAASSRRASARAASANSSRCCACTRTSRNGRWRSRCQNGLAERFTTASHLVHELIEARDEKRLLCLQAHLSTRRYGAGGLPGSRTGHHATLRNQRPGGGTRHSVGDMASQSLKSPPRRTRSDTMAQEGAERPRVRRPLGIVGESIMF